VDTADVYSAGASEEIVVKALKGRRDDVVLATKFFVPMGDDPNQRGGSRRWIITEVETPSSGSAPTGSTSSRSTDRTQKPTLRKASAR
jgi:Aldo/keto reductase family